MEYKEKALQIEAIILNYFEGIYYGNIGKLENCFAPNAYLYGDISGVEYLKNLNDYLEGVKNRKSPKDLNEAFKMEIISIEVLGNIAVAKLHVPMLGYNYYDYLSLAIVDSNWKIVNKLFTHVV